MGLLRAGGTDSSVSLARKEARDAKTNSLKGRFGPIGAVSAAHFRGLRPSAPPVRAGRFGHSGPDSSGLAGGHRGGPPDSRPHRDARLYGQPLRPLSDGVFDRATGTILYRLARGPPKAGSTNYPDATSTGRGSFKMGDLKRQGANRHRSDRGFAGRRLTHRFAHRADFIGPNGVICKRGRRMGAGGRFP